jgi:hypothetical protein
LDPIISWLGLGLSALIVPTLIRVWSVDWKKLENQTDQLYKWHNVLDDDGVPIWYVRRSLEEAILKLSDNIMKQTIVYDKQLRLFEIHLAKWEDLSKTIDELESRDDFAE